LRDRASVQGDIVSAGTVQRQTATVVSGQVIENSAIATSPLDCFKPAFPATNAGNKPLEPGQVVQLQPGAYGSVTIKQNATLKLTSGTYYFESLSTEPQSILNANTSSGTLRIYVRSALTHRGKIVRSGGGPERLLIGYLGSAAVPIEQPLLATLVAPNAKVDLKALSGSLHAGAIFARQVELAPQTTFTRAAYSGSWNP